MWFYEGQPFSEEMIGDHWGFIYELEHIPTGKKYIGMKYFTKAGYRQVKGKKKKLRKPSDWQNYFGSSPELLRFIEEHGTQDFKRTILHLCPTLGNTKYMETKTLFTRNVLEEKLPNGEWAFWNGNICVKYTRRGAGIK